MEVPPGVPVGILWFAAWVSVSLTVGLLIDRLARAAGQLQREIEEVTDRALDELNAYVQRLVMTGPARADDSLRERPISDQSEAERLYRRAVNAWRPLHRHKMVERAGRLGVVFSAIHAVAALAGGLAWWLAAQHNAATVANLAVFSGLFLPVIAALATQVWGHFCAGTQLRV